MPLVISNFIIIADSSNTTIKTYHFIKEPTGRWYIDIPEWKGDRAELEMVAGADAMLDHVGKGQPVVELSLSEKQFEGASTLQLINDCSGEPGGGGIYLLKEYDHEVLNQEMWLCEVTEWVFGKLPPVIYFRKTDTLTVNLA